MKHIHFILLFFILSCSQHRVNIVLEVDNVYFYLKQDNYILKITSKSDDIEKIKKILKSYDKYNLSKSEEIQFKDAYTLFFQLGDNFYSFLKNDLIRFGLIEIEWLKLKKELNDKGYFRITEIDNFIMSQIQEKNKKEIYKYAINYLAKENLFVSIQEFFDRPYRYFNLNELDTIFMRLVILPESKEFTEYLIKKFGKNKVIKFAQSEYSKEKWEKFFGEKINDFEEEFFKYIENYKFPKNFNKDFEALIALYNKNSKKTLFKK
ncbi:MAG: hypothetical protein N2258_08330 [Brevinematales bacterium]|nr:hypothetical protein [Brevinematales bacterium]